jgi:hypothetical protein
MIFGDGPHQRRLRAVGGPGVDVGAALHEQPDGVDAAGARRRHQHRFAARCGGIRVSARVDEPAQDRRVAVGGGETHRRDAVPRRRLYVGAAPDERVDSLEIVPPHCFVQGRRAVRGDGDGSGRWGRLAGRPHGRSAVQAERQPANERVSTQVFPAHRLALPRLASRQYTAAPGASIGPI